jgi:hypothetical protein
MENPFFCASFAMGAARLRGAFLFRDDSSLVSSHKWDREGGWGPGGADPAEMDAARSGRDATREEAAPRSVPRDVARSTPRARFADAVRDLLDTCGDCSGDDGETDDGSFPEVGARAWFARSRAGGGARAAADDADAPRSDVGAATAWMLARLDEATAEARRARRDERRRAETKLSYVRASHETRLRALDAQHRAALDAWKRDELERARNAARDVVRDTEARAEGVVREARAASRAAEARAEREASRAEAAEEETRATRARHDECLRRFSRETKMRDANVRTAQTRAIRRRAFEQWRLARAKTSAAELRAVAANVNDTNVSLKKKTVRAERQVNAALAFGDVRCRLSFLAGTGAFAFRFWRKLNTDAKRVSMIAEARQKEHRRQTRVEIALAYRRRRLNATLTEAFQTWRVVSAETASRREAVEREQWARKLAETRDLFRTLARASAWCAKRRRDKAARLWRAAAKDAAAADGKRVDAFRRRARVFLTRRAISLWRAFVVSNTERRVKGILVCRSKTVRKSFCAWRARAEAHAALRSRAARAAAARSARTCLARLAASEALEATRPLLFLERAFARRYGGDQSAILDVWTRVLEGRAGDRKTESRPRPKRKGDARDVGTARRRARLFAARAADCFSSWARLSRRESRVRATILERHRVRKPLRACFSTWRVRVVSERNRAVAKLEARRLFSARRALAAWWLLAAENAEAGERRREPEPNEDFNDVRDGRKRLKNENESESEDPIDTQSLGLDACSSWRRALSALRWETPRGRPAAHWLGAALSAAARLARTRRESAEKSADEKKNGAPLAPLRAALARRVVVAGERLNRERDARLAALDAFRGVLERTNARGPRGETGEILEKVFHFSSSRPRVAWTRARGAEEEALRATRDVLVALGDLFSDCGSADAHREGERDERGRYPSRERTLPRIPRRPPASRGSRRE